MLLINTSNNPIDTICRWWRHSPLVKKNLENTTINKQTQQLPEEQTKLPKREIKQTQNKLQIFGAK
jgi:hypothetical protein